MRNKCFALCLTAFASLFIGSQFWNGNNASAKDNKEAYYQNVSAAMAELKLPTTNDYASINTAGDNLWWFIHYRSGVTLNAANKVLLKDLEQQSWAKKKKLFVEELSQIFTELAIERMNNATKIEIAQATETLRGFVAPGLPSGFVKGRAGNIRLRASGEGTMTPEKFQSQFYERTEIEKFIFEALVRNRAQLEIKNRIDIFSKANNSTFGADADLTPMQAVLIAYSIVSDDQILHNQNGLTAQMQAMQTLAIRVAGSYPSPNGHRAYGANGYLHSSPVDLVLSDDVTKKLLDLIKERSNL